MTHADPVLVESLRRHLGELAPAAVCAWLFGSRARGTARLDSDVDVAVLFAEDPEPTLAGQPYGLEADLQDATGLDVQLVAANTAPAELVHHILRDGILLLDRDPARRVRFEVQRRNEYFDLLPLLTLYRQPRPTEPAP
ncbi:MAG: nucleotidyltransferase domain-containing protein [Deltaproteobacteria bacterium]|nr:nucleotidyltransferase domain-containing protein [Deltaproteobacteria bacterium]